MAMMFNSSAHTRTLLPSDDDDYADDDGNDDDNLQLTGE